MTTDAPATVAGRPGPDPPTRHATTGDISARSPAEVFDALESSPQGLAAGKAASRLAALGPNELRAAKRPPVIYAHLNRVIRNRDLNVIYVAGPGHGGPGMVANTYLEGTYTERYPHITQDTAGLAKLFRQFSFPGARRLAA